MADFGVLLTIGKRDHVLHGRRNLKSGKKCPPVVRRSYERRGGLCPL